MSIKNRIKQWLFGEELEQLNKIKQVLDGSIEYLNIATEKYDMAAKIHNIATDRLNESKLSYDSSKNITQDALKLMNSICDVGVDVHMHPRGNEYSWAVICAHGKMDYVKFIPLQRNEVMEVARFLKQFEYSPRCVDTPWGHKQMIEDIILKM